jgi:hypothetical protein
MSRLTFVFALFIACGMACAQTASPYQNPPAQSGNTANSVASPWQWQGAFGAGYSNVRFPHAGNGAFYNPSGPYFDASGYFPIPGYSLPIIGIGLSASGYFDKSNPTGFNDLYSNVNLISPELRAGFPIPLSSGDQGLYLFPAIGVGPLFNNYGYETPVNGTNYHYGIAVEVRPSVELGYRWSQSSVGVVGSYSQGWGDFGSYGSISQESRVGLVFSYRF